MSPQVSVDVLLATYNGERYLREQIDSILGQDYRNLRVLARDDGSSDGTVGILNEYAEKFSGRFMVLSGGRTAGGAKENFLFLMKASESAYVCFSDQDDVWVPDKVSETLRGMETLESTWGAHLPLLVFTDLRVVDHKLATIHESFWKHENLEPKRIDRLPGLLAQNVVTGCTAMMNRRLVELSLSMPEAAYMHDQWVALLASALGKAKALHRQTVLYRQHDRNFVGSRQSTRSWADLVRRIRNREARLVQWKNSQRQAEAFLEIHMAELSPENRDLLKVYIQCGKSESRLWRSYILLRHGFLRAGWLAKLANLADLWMARGDEPK